MASPTCPHCHQPLPLPRERAAATPPPAPPAPDRARPEVAHRSVQNLLLSLGVALLAVAGLVLAAVTYDRLGAGGRATALLALTALVAGAARPLLARGLTASAETTTVLTLLLAGLDAAGLRSLGLAQGAGTTAYAAGTAAALGALSLGYAALVPVRAARLGTLVLLHVAPLLAASAAGAGPGAAALVLVALAAADLGLLVAGATDRGVRTAGLLSAACALLLAGPAALADDASATGALLALAALTAASALAHPAAAAATTPLLALTAVALLGADHDGAPLLVALVALAGTAAATALPHAQRAACLLGALATAGLAAASQSEAVLSVLALPLSWLAEPWALTGSAAGSAATSLSPDHPWPGSGPLPVAFLLVAAGCLLLAELRAPALALAGASVLVLPVALDAPYAVALAWGAALTVSLAAVAALRLPALLPVAALAGAHLLVWSAADQTATLAVTALLALLCGAVAVRVDGPLAPAAAAALLATEVAALGAAGTMSAPQVGGLLLLAVAGLAACAAALGSARAAGVDAATALTAVTAAGLASADEGWASWVLAGLGLVALATALRPDRRRAAIAGALLLSASSWVRLAGAGVEDPEPYVVPLGLLALVLGHLRRREEPGTRSLAAYGPGLSLVLVPSLLAVGTDGLARPLLLGLVSVVVLLVGARTRLQAPLLLGGGVLALDALHLLAPYAADLPRWVPLAVVGTALVALGTTFEQRGRDLARLRERYDAMA